MRYDHYYLSLSLIVDENHVPVRQGVPLDMLIADFTLALDVDDDNGDIFGR